MPPPSSICASTASSRQDSTIRIPALVKACVRQGMPALALTDEVNLFALVKFYKAAEAAGLKPIARRPVAGQRPTVVKPTRLSLLCQNRAGYFSTCRA